MSEWSKADIARIAEAENHAVARTEKSIAAFIRAADPVDVALGGHWWNQQLANAIERGEWKPKDGEA